jgi:hypothetical protein
MLHSLLRVPWAYLAYADVDYGGGLVLPPNRRYRDAVTRQYLVIDTLIVDSNQAWTER